MRREVIGVIFIAALSLNGCEKSPVARAEDAVRAVLKDPESARFQEVERCGDTQIFSGKVNSKNGFGGYTGNKTFVVDGDSVVLEDDSPFDEWSSEMDKCTNGLNAELAKIKSGN